MPRSGRNRRESAEKSKLNQQKEVVAMGNDDYKKDESLAEAQRKHDEAVAANPAMAKEKEAIEHVVASANTVAQETIRQKEAELAEARLNQVNLERQGGLKSGTVPLNSVVDQTVLGEGQAEVSTTHSAPGSGNPRPTDAEEKKADANKNAPFSPNIKKK